MQQAMKLRVLLYPDLSYTIREPKAPDTLVATLQWAPVRLVERRSIVRVPSSASPVLGQEVIVCSRLWHKAAGLIRRCAGQRLVASPAALTGLLMGRLQAADGGLQPLLHGRHLIAQRSLLRSVHALISLMRWHTGLVMQQIVTAKLTMRPLAYVAG